MRMDEEKLVHAHSIPVLSMLVEVILSSSLQVNAWLTHFVDCIYGNSRPRVMFWGDIAAIYNATTDNVH
jgi:hypothetical protein